MKAPALAPPNRREGHGTKMMGGGRRGRGAGGGRAAEPEHRRAPRVRQPLAQAAAAAHMSRSQFLVSSRVGICRWVWVGGEGGRASGRGR